MRRLALATLAPLACLALQGCKPAGAESEPTPALASVNGIEIRTLAPSATPVDRARLDQLIDAQLLQEAAIAQRLDRDPLVKQAMARAGTDILAQAYLEARAATLAPPTAAQVAAYLDAHAHLFAQRKLFAVDQLVLASKDFTPQLKQVIDSASSLEQVVRWLDARGLRHQRVRLARHSGELPAPLLKQLASMRRQQMVVVVAGAQTTIDSLRDVIADPVPREQALAQAEAILRENARVRADQMEIARLRSSARIAYFNQPQGAAPATLGALRTNPTEKQ